MKNKKYIVILMFILVFILGVSSFTILKSYVSGKADFKNIGYTDANKDDDILNGKIFYGTATEVTSPDVDRMPKVYDEIITFQDGKLNCETIKNFSDAIEENYYSAAIDDRRAVALTVVNFNSVIKANLNGAPVTIDFTGNVIGNSRLNGILIISNPDKCEVKFLIEAQRK
ncbi:MAG: hypothetical protein LH629_06980 [Ignavibacteria bacterium]|nr:hypothetical protein [Ignavibacteria bacterium]